MNKTIFAITLFSLIFIPLADAQRYRNSYDDSEGGGLSLGLAPMSLLFRTGKFNVRAEYAYRDNMSLALMVGIPRTTKAPLWLIDDLILDAVKSDAKDRFRSTNVVLEHRFYTGHAAPKGFYLAPYLRYNNYDLTYVSANASNPTYETAINGRISGFGIGGALGGQFKIGEHFSIDFTVIGLDYKWLTGSLTYRSNDPANEVVAFRDKIQAELEDIPIVGKRLVSQIDGDQVRVRSSLGGWPGYRCNLSVNYVF